MRRLDHPAALQLSRRIESLNLLLLDGAQEIQGHGEELQSRMPERAGVDSEGWFAFETLARCRLFQLFMQLQSRANKFPRLVSVRP